MVAVDTSSTGLSDPGFPSSKAQRVSAAALGFDVAAVQALGQRKRQEDRLLVEVLGNALVLAVADGMGGHPSGDAASHIAIETLFTRLKQDGPLTKDNVQVRLHAAAVAANVTVKAYGAGFSGPRYPGSTLIALIVFQDCFAMVAVGDSLLYAKDRQGLRLINTRHVQSDGKITSWIGSHLPHADGTETLHSLNEVDAILIASDGIETLSGQEIAKALRAPHSAQETLRLMLDAILVKADPEQDNVSLVLLKTAFQEMSS